MKRGKLLVLEGVDEVGKTTLATALVEVLRAASVDARYLSFPGRKAGTLGDLVYRLHHDPSSVGLAGPIAPSSLQLLHVAAHIEAIEDDVLPSLAGGAWVVLDRYWWSSWVYGAVAGIPARVLDSMVEIERAHWGPTEPSVVFLVERPPVDGAQAETAETAELRRAYEELAAREAPRYPVRRLDNRATVDSALAAIRTELAGLLMP